MRTLILGAFLAAACGNNGGDTLDAAADSATDGGLIDPRCPGARVSGLYFAVLRSNGVCDYACDPNDPARLTYCNVNDAGVGECVGTRSISNCGSCGHACPIMGGIQWQCGADLQCARP